MPTFDIPTQRFTSRFIKAVPNHNLALIKRLVHHTWFDGWKCRSRCGFHGRVTDNQAQPEWVEAQGGIAKSLVGLECCTLVIHFSGGGTRFSDPTDEALEFIATLEQNDRKSPMKGYMISAAERQRGSSNAPGHWMSKVEAEEWLALAYRGYPVSELPDNWVAADWIPIERRESNKEEVICLSY